MGGEGVGDGEDLGEVIYISQPEVIYISQPEVMYSSQPAELTWPLGSVSQLGEVKVKPLSVPASMGKAWREGL